MSAPNITATKTSLPNGKTRYEVFADGQLVDSITSKVADYTVIHVQRWAPIGADAPADNGRENYGNAAAWSPRYSRKPKPVGAKIEYGFCAANVTIEAV